MKIYVLGNAHRPGVEEVVRRWLPLLEKSCEVVAVDLLQEKDLSALPTADLALVFGGDGAILRAARQMGYRQVPVLGVNLGRLGFLADISPDDFATCFEQVRAGSFRVNKHLMFECVLADHAGAAQHTFLGLNEVVVHTVPPFHMLELEVDADGQPMSQFSGDGLIVSTPVGSTAHNLSAGGPILEQQLRAFVVTPICPHTLTYRPVVVSAEKPYTIRMRRGEEQAVVIIDGQEALPITDSQRVVLRAAPVTFDLVKVPGRSYFQTLRDKLHWGTPPSYRREP